MRQALCLIICVAVTSTLWAQSIGDAGVVRSVNLSGGGFWAANVGDYDQDSVADFGLHWGGEIHLVSGSSLTEIGTITAPASGVVGLCDTGDVNGDGTPDLFIAAGGQSSPQLYLVSGSDSAVLHSFPGVWPVSDPSAHLVAGGLDLNGLGAADVAFCRRDFVQCFSGETFGVLWTHGNSPTNECNSVCLIPSIDGDPHPDLVIGQTGRAFVPGGTAGHPGRVRCVSGLTGALRWEFVDTGNLARHCGEYVSSIADLNGDGFRDILVSKRLSLGQYGSPRVLSGLNGQPLFAQTNTFGANADEVGDLNFDGVADFATILTSGTIIASGANGSILQNFGGGDAVTLVTTRGDSNGDGNPDMLALKYLEIVAVNPFGTAEFGHWPDPQQPLSLSWTASTTNLTSGNLSLSGWTPFAPAILIVGPVRFHFRADGTPVLVDYLHFPVAVYTGGLDATGLLQVPLDLIQIGLVNRQVQLQGFVADAGVAYSSNGLEIRFLTH